MSIINLRDCVVWYLYIVMEKSESGGHLVSEATVDLGCLLGRLGLRLRCFEVIELVFTHWLCHSPAKRSWGSYIPLLSLNSSPVCVWGGELHHGLGLSED